jgi:glycosyltransferase involved in cell wall biosynthesis
MLEAMASGKPIIVSDSGGMPEIVKNDINGYVVPKGNHEVLAEKMINLLSCPKLSAKLGKTGREQVMHRYTKRIYAENILKVFEEAIKGYPKTHKKKIKPKRKFFIAQEELVV